MSELAGSVRRAAIGAGGLVVLLVGFLTYSGAVTFSNWPWTKTESYTAGGVLGFQIGDSKRSCFDRAVLLEQEGEIRALQLVDAEPGTYEEKFKGTELTESDFEAVRASNLWHLGLTGENAWLLLEFEDDHLARVTKKHYRGPTE